MRVAVVGAGIFGATAAVELARAGYQVDLYERHRGLMCGASRANQGRLHRGYHYPRSESTALLTASSAGQFAERFPAAVVSAGRNYYAIAAEGSRTSAEDYRAFCGRLSLPLVSDAPPMLIGRSVDGCWRVGEGFIDLNALRGQLHVDLRKAGVTIHFGRSVDPERLDHDTVVLATYGRGWPEPLRWQVTEAVLVKLGPQFARISLVVLDGAFVSLDPVPSTGMHMLYDVAHSVHAENVGTQAEIPEHLAALLDTGPALTKHSRMDAMLQTLRRYVRGVGMPTYHGSLFTVRAVLPDVQDTDERLTLIRREGRLVHLLAGKIDTAVWAARQVTEAVREEVAV